MLHRKQKRLPIKRTTAYHVIMNDNALMFNLLQSQNIIDCLVQMLCAVVEVFCYALLVRIKRSLLNEGYHTKHSIEGGTNLNERRNREQVNRTEQKE